jgi:membrane protease YdiL (CAAX protease family)
MKLLNTVRRFPLTGFFVLAYAWTWLCWWSVVAASSGQLSLAFPKEWLATLGQFGPFAAGLLVTWAASGRAGLRKWAGRLVRWRVGPVWLAVSVLLLPATMLLAILLFASANGTMATLRFRDTWATLPTHFIFTLLLAGPLGEEPGWRGFALPRLQVRYGSVWASVWLGLLSAGWHLPLWWMYPAPTFYPLFVVGAVLLNFLFTWLFNHTHGSVLYSLVFHTSLSLASVRLPDVPAYPLWVPCLLSVVLIILLCDRRLHAVPHACQAT